MSLLAVVFFAAGCSSSGSRGADVVLDVLPCAQKAVEALLRGSAAQATAGYIQIPQLAAADRPVRSLLGVANRFPAAILASPSRKDIRAFHDLRGGKIGLPGLGSPNHQFARHVSAMRGLKSKDVRRVSLPSLSVHGRMPAGEAAAILKLLNFARDSSLNVDLAKTYTDQFLEAKP
ncbi:MAG: ABC transporter substrate-binding protein [Bryobacterales bacterium]|nr:ABC transporter substrate-binding protein [Bryobacterales bacterium]